MKKAKDSIDGIIARESGIEISENCLRELNAITNNFVDGKIKFGKNSSDDSSLIQKQIFTREDERCVGNIYVIGGYSVHLEFLPSTDVRYFKFADEYESIRIRTYDKTIVKDDIFITSDKQGISYAIDKDGEKVIYSHDVHKKDDIVKIVQTELSNGRTKSVLKDTIPYQGTSVFDSIKDKILPDNPVKGRQKHL